MLSLLAHAAPISYRFPLPIWIYVVAGGTAVAASAPAAALAIRRDARVRESRDLLPALRRLHLGQIGLALATVLFAWALVGGLGGRTIESGEFFENPITVLVWIDFWIGLGIVSAFIGNVWDAISPLSYAARALDRALARRGVAQALYPERLGQWPAVVLVLGWTWAELIWAPAKEPRVLALMAIGYCVFTLGGSAVFGAETWLGNVELFTVVARTFGRFAPLRVQPDSVRLRPYGQGIRTDGDLPAGGGALVVTLLATVVYDGFSQTGRFFSLEASFLSRWHWLGLHVQVLDTALMVAIVALFVLAYLLVCGSSDAARAYAPTLIPIAAVYFAAHYLAYLLLAGQTTLGTLVDPFGHSWNPWGLGEYPIRRGIAPAVLVWWTQVALIVWGHVVAVFAAHRVALRRHEEPTRALLAQAPMVLLMVAYTMIGLWVLAQQIKVGA